MWAAKHCSIMLYCRLSVFGCVTSTEKMKPTKTHVISHVMHIGAEFPARFILHNSLVTSEMNITGTLPPLLFTAKS